MTSLKRPHEDEDSAEKPAASPIMSMFKHFRDELDEHHDRRERAIKASRDITAASKKIIFSLQRSAIFASLLILTLSYHPIRLRTPGPLPSATLKDITPHYARITNLFQSLLPDLRGLNGHRYAHQISGGIQEFIEAASFQHYIETETLISYDEARGKLPAGVMLTEEDYLGGLFDLSGEMMRFAVTGLATASRGQTYGDSKGDVLGDMRELRTLFERLDFRSTGNYGDKERERKMEVLRQSVEKVEVAVYGLVVRGSERPEGWVPDLEVSGVREIGVE